MYTGSGVRAGGSAPSRSTGRSGTRQSRSDWHGFLEPYPVDWSPAHFEKLLFIKKDKKCTDTLVRHRQSCTSHSIGRGGVREGGLGKAHDRTETPRDPRRQQIPEPASPPHHNLAGVALSLGAERVLPLTRGFAWPHLEVDLPQLGFSWGLGLGTWPALKQGVLLPTGWLLQGRGGFH